MVITVKAKEVGIDPMPKTGRSVSIVSEPQEKEEEEKTNETCGTYRLLTISVEKLTRIFDTSHMLQKIPKYRYMSVS